MIPVPSEFVPAVTNGKVASARHIRNAAHSVYSVDELRTLLLNSQVDIGATVQVGCHNVAGWGGGLYRVASKGSLVDNGGTVVIGGALAALYLGAPDIATFGAVGDGTTDCTAAVQAAFEALFSADSGWFGRGRPTLLIPRGRFRISQTITSPAHSGFWVLRGAGDCASTFEWAGPAGVPMFLLRNASGILCEYFGLVGSQYARPSSGIEVRKIADYPGNVGVTGCQFRHLSFTAESLHLANGIAYTCDAGADTNNDYGVVEYCFFVNYTESGFAARHLNSLAHSVHRCVFATAAPSAIAIDTLGDANSSVANVGGSFSASHCGSSGNEYTFRFGAGSWYVVSIDGWRSEVDRNWCSVPHAPEGTASINVVDTASHYYTNAVSVASKMDVTFSGTKLVAGIGVDFTVAADGRLAFVNSCDVVTKSVANSGDLIRDHVHERNYGATYSGAGRRFGEADRTHPLITTVTGGLIDLADVFPYDESTLALAPAAPSDVNTLGTPGHPSQRVTLFAANGNATLRTLSGGGNLYLKNGAASRTLSTYETATFVQMGGAFANYWFEV